MSDLHQKFLMVLDDREFTSGDVSSLVGIRRFGDIIFKRRALIEHFRACLPEWAGKRFIHLRTAEDVVTLRATLEASSEDCAVCVIAGRAGFIEPERINQLIERLPYSEEDFTDRLYKPLLVFLRNAHSLIEQWAAFESAPLHAWEQGWQGSQRVQSVQPLDLGKISDFLSFTSGSTATRHFNQVSIDTYYYTNSSSDRRKMLAEYSFYGLVPESMRPWLIQPFDYQDHNDHASYRMLRYYFADAALQWVHGAFNAETFESFVDRLLFFVAERPRRICSKEKSSRVAYELFVIKVEARVKQFLALDDGQRINVLATSATSELDLNQLLKRYLHLYNRYKNGFAFEYGVVGHGDPCFSNILYDQQRYLLKLIDPKGAINEEDLWTHPLYDLCKISHSALGDYDFINNGLYSVGFSDNNDLVLYINSDNNLALKSIFRSRVHKIGYDERVMRLGEASLFLSMLPLHIDYPNKVIAFMLKAKQILDEVDSE
ncbi:hypothetical protein [Limnohabitans sp. T6-20]|uniref:hypothetical protein n=1 Tax=Limnohabitans sp. T6-20 TaxID=1100725 RepID=UPI000D331B90|nr:hypothetical protein [Limnohabitans sp. T6-20]PUE09767.1 hypothetical protein B9Z33_06340 [Limnohabitans sp. T6-20]